MRDFLRSILGWFFYRGRVCWVFDNWFVSYPVVETVTQCYWMLFRVIVLYGSRHSLHVALGISRFPGCFLSFLGCYYDTPGGCVLGWGECGEVPLWFPWSKGLTNLVECHPVRLGGNVSTSIQRISRGAKVRLIVWKCILDALMVWFA